MAQTVRSVKQQLDKYGYPENIPGAVVIASGAFRTAYRVGRYVVKDRDQARGCIHRSPSVVRRLLRSSEITVVPTVRYRRWVIQPFVSKVGQFRSREDEYSGLDLHESNIGMYRGRIVAFDW